MSPSSGGDRPAPVQVFVAAAGNEFMVDIASWIVEACVLGGRDATLISDRLPQHDGSINLVVAPHEFFELFDAPAGDLQAAARASVCVATEQPGTPWFELTVDVCQFALHTLDINPHGVAALRERGIDASRLQLGAVPSMAVQDPLADDRPIDVLFMGGLDDRRGRILAELASRLSRRHSDLRLFPFDRPVNTETPGLLFGAAKYERLRAAKLLINLHRERSTPKDGDSSAHYFEWARMVEAMANGCVVVSEPSADHDPLRAGVDFVSVAIDDMGSTIEALLDGETERRTMASSAHRMVTDELALGTSLPRLLDELERARTIGPRATQRSVASSARWLLGQTRTIPPVRLGPFRPVVGLQREAKRLALADTRMLRRIDRASCMITHGAAEHVTRSTTPARDAQAASPNAPDVSAIVTLYNYATVVEGALTSLGDTTDVSFEIIVVDDHSTDHGRNVVTDFMERRPDRAITLLAKDTNAGLAAARNDAVAAASGRYVFVMDADNQVYPTCLSRLVATLDQHPDAAAAYAMLEDFGSATGVRSCFAWDAERLCRANYIDAQAMWRRRDLLDLGGYRDDDDHVYGWEDWDLWLRLAAQDGRAILHREILGRYRVQPSSMISLTNLETDDSVAALRDRYPTLPWPTAAPTTLGSP